MDFVETFFSYSIVTTITAPTRVTHNTATLIDNDRLKTEVIVIDLSDHFPIHLQSQMQKSNNKDQGLRFM